jgi:diacylglycerol kinase family enzyme
VRALLLVNPHATSTTRLRRDVIARALASAVELEVVETRYRGHATTLAADGARAGRDLIITLGGDGTVNEAVNGIRQSGHAPALAPLPGGSANVFVRALGLPGDPVDAAGVVLAALAAGRSRSVSLGRAEDRYFTFNSGLGIDAEVVRAVEGRRAHGRSVSPALYMRMTARQFWRLTDRRAPAVSLDCEARDSPDHAGSAEGTEPKGRARAKNYALSKERQPGKDGPPAKLFWCTVSNTSPWTYLGSRPVRTNPGASFETGLDVFGMRSLSTLATLRVLRQMLTEGRDEPPRGRAVLAAHDLAAVTLTASRPVAFQVDGEYMGEREQVRFEAVPEALRVVM